MAKKVLVVVDMQNDFITGSLGTPEAQAIVPKVVEKIQGFGGRCSTPRTPTGRITSKPRRGETCRWSTA